MDKRTDVTLGRISGDLRSGDPFGGAISACYDRIFGIPSGITCTGNGILVPESPGLRPVRQEKAAKSEKTEVLLWVIFAVLLLIQLVLAVVMVYGDGDDAYYVAISTAAQESGKMYQKILILA